MKIRVRFIGIAPSDAQEMANDIERRVGFALDRLSHSIREVRVSLADVNGPRGGVDQQCVLTITSSFGGPVVASALEETRGEAVVKSLKRGRRRLEQKLVRQRRRAS